MGAAPTSVFRNRQLFLNHAGADTRAARRFAEILRQNGVALHGAALHSVALHSVALHMNAVLPKELIGGPDVPLQLIVGSYSSTPGATIAVK